MRVAQVRFLWNYFKICLSVWEKAIKRFFVVVVVVVVVFFFFFFFFFTFFPFFSTGDQFVHRR